MAYEGWQDTATARVPLVLPAAYGYVLLSAFISVCAISFLSESVAKARKKYKVDYPEFYASHYVVCAPSQAELRHELRVRFTEAARSRASQDRGPLPEGGRGRREQALQLLPGARRVGLRNSRGMPTRRVVSSRSRLRSRAPAPGQRAHQNALETYPQFLLFLLIGGLADPIISACGGIVYSAGKVAYGLGYHTGDPRKRMWGAPAYIGLLMCVCTFLRFAIQLCRGKQANGV